MYHAHASNKTMMNLESGTKIFDISPAKVCPTTPASSTGTAEMSGSVPPSLPWRSGKACVGFPTPEL